MFVSDALQERELLVVDVDRWRVVGDDGGDRRLDGRRAHLLEKRQFLTLESIVVFATSDVVVVVCAAAVAVVDREW